MTLYRVELMVRISFFCGTVEELSAEAGPARDKSEAAIRIQTMDFATEDILTGGVPPLGHNIEAIRIVPRAVEHGSVGNSRQGPGC
jgi:hypothetical protein